MPPMKKLSRMEAQSDLSLGSCVYKKVDFNLIPIAIEKRYFTSGFEGGISSFKSFFSRERVLETPKR